jgi:DNA modification methylase
MPKVVDQYFNDKYAIYNADCIDVMKGLPDESIHYSIYSPPFEGLYVYSDNPRDLSNSSKEQFWEHYRFVIRDTYRITKSGRLTSVHCTQLPATQMLDGFVGMYDFRGEIIREHQKAGFIYHSEVVIRKDPHTTLKLSKTRGLYHKNIIKDGVIARNSWADYIVTFLKPGVNLEPVVKKLKTYFGDDMTDDERSAIVAAKDKIQRYTPEDAKSMEIWSRYGEPVWTDIDRTDVLSRFEARDEPDERHLTPLQLTPIRRYIYIWTNPNEVVFSPFAGIGSAGYVALELGRRFIGVELKPSYYQQAVKNLKSMESQIKRKAFVGE